MLVRGSCVLGPKALNPGTSNLPNWGASGEKLYEEFHTERESVDWDRFNSLGVIKAEKVGEKGSLIQKIKEVEKLFDSKQAKADIVKALGTLVPNFNHIETGRHLDQKM